MGMGMGMGMGRGMGMGLGTGLGIGAGADFAVIALSVDSAPAVRRESSDPRPKLSS